MHLYQRRVGTTEHFGSISWRYGTGLIGQYCIFYMFDLEFSPRCLTFEFPHGVLLYNSVWFLTTFGVVCTYNIAFR